MSYLVTLKWDWSCANETDVQLDVSENPGHNDCKWHKWKFLKASFGHLGPIR